ncbi:MAG: phosphotransferase [Legionellales bacterium]|nr:phosphotransferase [Legionellales bacterium]
MNQNHLAIICMQLQLGSPKEMATRVYGSRGGSFMWRVNTEKESYAIKQLASVIDLKSEKIIAKYELSETIAYRFAQKGIPAVSALDCSGKHLLIVENTGYLVYSWVDGYTLGRNEISEIHATKIAEIIAKLHSINMNDPEIPPPRVDLHSSETIIEAIDRALALKLPFAQKLKENQNFILSMNKHYLAITPLLLEDTVVTHGDLDQLNVLWDKNEQPILIDWESVRKMNSTREIVRTSLAWSGSGTENFSFSLYAQMLRTYTQSGGVLNVKHLNAALYSLVGSMVNWMLYNIELACTSDVSSTRDTAIDEVNGAVRAMMQLEILIPELLKIV